MKTSLKIYQVYYRKNQKKDLDGGFSHWNNRKNRRPEWAELWIMLQAWANNSAHFSELTGFFSWKFGRKTDLTSEMVVDFIGSHPGYDCYIFNPLTLQTALFASVWDQGEHWHPGIKAHADRVLKECGIQADLDGYVDGFATTAYCNYFVASPQFWTAYFALMERVFENLEKQRRGRTGPWQTTIHDNREYKFVPFLIERCFGVVTRLNPGLKIIPYRYSEEKQAERTPGFEGLIAQADEHKTECRDNRQNPAFGDYLKIQQKIFRLLDASPDRDKLLLR